MSTTTAPTTLPPTPRDFFVYERIVRDLASTRQVAAEAQISQTRVRKLVGKVLEWLAETLPAKASLAGEAQLLVARHIAADRLETVFRDANKKWLATDQCKYANLALRVIAAQSKLPAVAGHYEALMAETLEAAAAPSESRAAGNESRSVGNALRGVPNPTDSPPIANNSSATPDLGPSTLDLRPVPAPPPVEDCSPSPVTVPRATAPKAHDPAPTPVAETPSDSVTSTVRATRRAFLSPAHLSEPSTENEAITEIKLSPDRLGASLHRPLSRRERRRLRRHQQA